MTSDENGRIAKALTRRAGSGADVRHVADAIVALWREIELQLTPIIGARGVAAMHSRSVFLTSREHVWLSPVSDRVVLSMDLELLRSAVQEQDHASAMTGGGALFQTFHDLLISMVGPALTERLLRDVWDLSTSGSPAQDTQA